jgi:hypothetical protein
LTCENRRQSHFTQPPARFTEATLIKTLEENGIGRPSTYAPIITTVIQRGYVERKQKLLVPTALGEVTSKLLKEQFSNIVDVAFTANMEQMLDRVEDGDADWVKALDGFYRDFETTLQTPRKICRPARESPDEETDVVCEQCGRNNGYQDRALRQVSGLPRSRSAKIQKKSCRRPAESARSAAARYWPKSLRRAAGITAARTIRNARS